MNGFPHYLLCGRKTVEYELLAIVAERDHAVRNRFGSQLIGGRVLHDHIPQFIVHHHELEQPNSAFIASVVAAVTALPSKELVLATGFLGHSEIK